MTLIAEFQNLLARNYYKKEEEIKKQQQIREQQREVFIASQLKNTFLFFITSFKYSLPFF